MKIIPLVVFCSSVLLLSPTVVSKTQRRYDGNQVFRLSVNTADDVKVLTSLEESNKELDFWEFPNDLMVPSDQIQSVTDFLNSHGIEFTVWINDVQKLIDGQTIPKGKAISASDVSISTYNFNYEVYHRWAEIDQWVKDTAARYPDLAKEFIIGKSYENRVMRTLKIGVDTGSEKYAVWYNGGIHAREWVSPATVMWMTNQFLEDYSNDVAQVKTLLETFDLYVLPVMNPDGYDYTWTNERLWRKTRSINLGSECVGTDPNRNFAYEWGGDGSSGDPCSLIFRGPFPLSEVEIKSVADFIEEQGKLQQFKVYIDFHSYSQLWLSSWGYTYDLPPEDDYATMYEQMTHGCEAIHDVHGTNYTYGAGSTILYTSAGSSKDWAYGMMGIVYAYTVELRDTGEYGFLLPEDQILETAQEMYAGFKAALQYNIDSPYP